MKKTIKLNNLDLNLKIISRARSNKISFSIKSKNTIVLNKPKYIPEILTIYYLKQHSDLIIRKINSIKEIKIDSYLDSKERARTLIHQRLKHFNRIYNLKYNQLRIKNQSSLWGSCSKAANLNFNYRLLFLKEELRDYVIVHELCHLKELNHSLKFWQLVSIAMPNYKILRSELKKIKF
jgi:hypothetical protein